MKQKVDAIKQRFDHFIKTNKKPKADKQEALLGPYWSHITKAVKLGISRKKVWEFLSAQGVNVRLGTLKRLLRGL